ncbi:hypothetical protein OIU84_015240 [Salix udensis]|uniref:Uncharacterized protein n=1 Tax=Salix udensis TaxID=889485 RepID=A0AAD6JFS4_9ROSI|nr:hypothetical protein OIU84_015240 [Salix udensis]
MTAFTIVSKTVTLTFLTLSDRSTFTTALHNLTVPVPASDEDVPAPAPTEASDINVDGGSGGEEEEGGEESEGMSGGKKAGIAVGVIMAACLVGFGGLVYKKRQDNIRRTAYGHAARRELL